MAERTYEMPDKRPVMVQPAFEVKDLERTNIEEQITSLNKRKQELIDKKKELEAKLANVQIPEMTEDDKDALQEKQFRAGAEAMMSYDPATAQNWLLRADEIAARKQNRVAGTSPSAIRQQLRISRDIAKEASLNQNLSSPVRELARQESMLLTSEMAKSNPSDVDVYAKIDRLYSGTGASSFSGAGSATGTGGTSYSSLSADIKGTLSKIQYKGKALDGAKNFLLQKINGSGLEQKEKENLTSELNSQVGDKKGAPVATDFEAMAVAALDKLPATTMGSKITGLNTARDLLSNASLEADTYRSTTNQDTRDQAANAMLTILARLVAGGVLSDGEFDTAKATSGADSALQTLKNAIGWVGKNVTPGQAKAVMERLNTYVKNFNRGRTAAINKFLDYVDPKKEARTNTVQTKVNAMVPDPLEMVFTVSGSNAPKPTGDPSGNNRPVVSTHKIKGINWNFYGGDPKDPKNWSKQ